MYRTGIRLRLVVGLIAIMSIICDIAVAQISWLRPEPKRAMTLQFLKPSFSQEDCGDKIQILWFMSTNLPISNQVDFVAEIPFLHYETEGWLWSHQENIFGNPYVGLQFQSPGASGVTGSFGIRLPVAQEGDDCVTTMAALWTTHSSTPCPTTISWPSTRRTT